MSNPNGEPMDGFYRACVKLYAAEPHGIEDDAAVFVPIFHDWIRNQSLDLVLFDVADYAHVPDSPGIMLVTHEISFALDRSDGRFGLLGQRRTPGDGGAVEAIASTLRYTLEAAALLEADPRVAGRLSFNTTTLRIEANDRLRISNTAKGFEAFVPLVRAAVEAALPGRLGGLARVENDPRDRLTVEVDLVSTGAREAAA